MKKYYLILLSSLALSSCAMLEPPGTQQVTRICDHVLKQTKTKWHDASLDEIYKDNPDAEMGKKEWFKGMSYALGVCQTHIYKGASRLEDRLALEKIRIRINQHYTKQEEKIFFERTGGKKLCSPSAELRMINMDELLLGMQKPEKGCLYYNNQNIIAKQVTDRGIIAAIWGNISDRVVFVYKGNELDNNVVDGELIEKGFFEYTGTFSYYSLLGQRTVYSFKRMLGNPMKGFLFYGAKNS